ncbi:MAG: cysteine synthase A [Spirochaetes bacterium]|nr:MAG: cysteine synthase A [Spirochaetota bacterium]
MRIAGSITDLVGKTPLIEIKSLSKKTGARIVGKLEYFNPLSSVKDRIALSMIEDAESKGLLKEGGMIVEATSGNTGIGLAFIAASRGYKIKIVMPDSLSIERRKLLKALGADLVLTPAEAGMKGAMTKADEILKEHPGSFNPGQFSNPANPQAHRENTVPEIIADTEGKVDIFIAGVGTGGTVTGCGETLKKYNPEIKVYAVEPAESPVISGGTPGSHSIQGIGAGFMPEILNIDIIDEVVTITSEDAGRMARGIALKEGLLLGISSGAALKAAEIIGSREENKDKLIIVILPDTGERYLSTTLFEKEELRRR